MFDSFNKRKTKRNTKRKTKRKTKSKTKSKQQLKIKDIGVVNPYTGENLKFYYRSGTSDDKVLTEIFTKGAYRKKKINFDVSEGETWIDIGGHIGLFSLYAISKGANKVYVYEADPDNYRILNKNIKLNKLSNRIKSRRVAVVADQDLGNKKSIDLWKSKNPNVNYRNTVVPKSRGIKITVPACKFNSVVRDNNADGMKIDIEGAEVPILTSLKSNYGKIHKLTFEFTLSSGKIREMQRVLRNKGFKIDIPPSTLKGHAGAWVDYVVHATK
jgi:FkbM family methyltransferase